MIQSPAQRGYKVLKRRGYKCPTVSISVLGLDPMSSGFAWKTLLLVKVAGKIGYSGSQSVKYQSLTGFLNGQTVPEGHMESEAMIVSPVS